MDGNRIIARIQNIQRKTGSEISLPRPDSRVGFAFNSMDRIDYTVRALAGIDSEKGFDVIWVDGSRT
ncbi:MAG TPA: hypothetical protein VNJ29_00420, partial [Candidatus Nitrosotenuis sp.]|nr:hypothetical protein [Candidatus Nitrosotenuis sp.]